MRYIKEFDALRGLMALWVVLGHCSTSIDSRAWFFQHKLYNNYAVTVFIFLSGFAISAMIDRRAEPYPLYLTRRFLRIFPVYLLYFLLSVIAARFALDTWLAAPDGLMKQNRIIIAQSSLDFWWQHIAAHLVALHGVIPTRYLPSSDYAFLGQAWSISLEWQFYLLALFILALTFSRKTPLTIFALFASALVIAYIRPFMPLGFLGHWLFDFAVGIASYYLLKSAEHPTLTSTNIVSTWTVVVFLLLLVRSIETLPYLIWATVVTLTLLARKDAGWLPNLYSRVFTSRPLVWAGEMAYSIYLSHMLVLLVVIRLAQHLGINQPVANFVFLSFVTVAVTLVISRISYRFVELPFHQFGRNLKRSTMPIAG